jgi:hypothetical protein
LYIAGGPNGHIQQKNHAPMKRSLAFRWTDTVFRWTDTLSLPFEELHRALMLLGSFPAVECAEILAPLRTRIHLARVQTILAAAELSNHGG